MEATLEGSSKVFREISFLAATWLKETNHSLQQQEVRLEQVEQDARDQGREVHANATDISCMQMSQRLHRERLERLESLHRENLERLDSLIHRQEQALAATNSKLKEVRELGKVLRAQARGREEQEVTCRPTAGPIARVDGQRVCVSVPNTRETPTGPLGASVGGVTPADKVKGSRKGSPGVGRLPTQPQDSEPWRGVESKTEDLSESGKRMPGGSQTPGNRVQFGPDHTETLSKLEDRSGGAPERSETVGLTSQSLEPKGAVPRSQAEEATEQPSVTISRSPLSLGEALEATAPLSVKRKALTSGNLSSESEIVPKTPGGGKRQKGSADEGTPRRTSARKAVEKLQRTTEGGIPSQNSVPQG